MSKYRKLYYSFLALIILLLIQPKGGTWFYANYLRWLYLMLLGFAIANLLTPLCIYLGHKLNILDKPDARKVHDTPVPRIGGIVIYTAFLITVVRNLQFTNEIIGITLGATIIFLLGLRDDIKPVSATARIVFQLLAAITAIYFGVRTDIFPTAMPFHDVFDIILTLLWFIGILNAVNFLDGIDGLVTSFGIVCSSLFFLIALPTEQKYLAWMCITLASVCMGFLPYNWNKAKIFLGDSGSTLIGFLLAGFAVFGTWADNNAAVAFSTPLLILSIPIFDMIYTTISRFRNGSVKNVKEWLEYVGKDHFHHRLLTLGLNVKQSVSFIVLLNLILGLGALLIRSVGSNGSYVLLIQAFGIFSIIVILMLSGRTIE
ncbi:MAG: hypothetical protein A2252_10585 [Elusimicrobia bacterium RIFOXYA2_FULL_39_19]|nr:MAG: hypothetical protein A2252_10585 [Elusimicrobia bacterium RIFOXYA2_FULL_39_19]